MSCRGYEIDKIMNGNKQNSHQENRDLLLAGKRIQLLRKLIDYHRTLYHTFDAPELPDAAFDTLKNELEELERKHPQFASKDSPTQKIGGRPLEKFMKVRHEVPMLSFFDAFSEVEMVEWEKRLQKHLGRKMADYAVKAWSGEVRSRNASFYFCELKIDGLAIELVYEHGRLVTAATRGDGVTGEDVTQNVGTIADVPQELSQLGKWEIPEHCVIRGEIYIELKELGRINAERKKAELAPYANSRNLAAGSIRQLDPSIAASRRLRSFQYDLVAGIPADITTHEEKHKVLASWGCTVSPYTRAAHNLREVFRLRDEWGKKREKLPYEIDGVVVLVNDNSLFDESGVVGKGSRGAIAYKFSPKEATTVVENVEFQVGRTGVITPVAVLKPVEVSGVTISHATLHNFDEINRLGLRIGDTVVITRSGDVIPKITAVLPALRTGKERIIQMPKQCPVDHSPVVRDGVFLRCANPRCGARNRNHIRHFVSRSALNIQGMGEKIIDRFLDEGLISHAGDIFFLREGDVAALDRFGEKSARNLMEQVEQAKKMELQKFLYALGIPHVGEETARTLASRLRSVERRGNLSVPDVIRAAKNLSLEELEELQDIGPKVAKSIRDWFCADENQEMIASLAKAGIDIIPPAVPKKKGIFSGLRIAVTGTLASMSRDRAKELIQKEGGHFDSAITQGTDIVVAGKNPGSKLGKAREQGIRVWSEEDFDDKIKK
jgi:DNA ligase (NAD+)